MVTFIAVDTSHLHHSGGSQGSGAMDSPPRPLPQQAGPGGWCWWRWRWCPRCRGRSPCRRGAGRGTGPTWWRSRRPPWRGSPAVWAEASGRFIIYILLLFSLIDNLWLTTPLNWNGALANTTLSPRARSAEHPNKFAKYKNSDKWARGQHLRHTATITLRKRERRPKEMILPIGSGWKTVPRNNPLFWQRPNTLLGAGDGL